jgi:hypothetical protein
MQAAAPGLMATFVHGLHQWQEGEPLSPPSNISAKLAEAFLEQTHIGWNASLKGFLSLKWQQIQAEHFERIGSIQTGVRFIAELIQKMFDTSWDFWHHRNHYLKRGDADEQVNLLPKLDSRIAHHYLLGSDDLPIRCQFLYHQSLSSILSSPLHYCLSWLQTVTTSRLRLRLMSPTFSAPDDEDLTLVDKIVNSRLMNRRKVTKKEPTLRTRVEPTGKTLLTVPRDLSDDSYDSPGVLIFSDTSPD